MFSKQIEEDTTGSRLIQTTENIIKDCYGWLGVCRSTQCLKIVSSHKGILGHEHLLLAAFDLH